MYDFQDFVHSNSDALKRASDYLEVEDKTMQTKDHYILARFMAEQFEIGNPFYRWAFVLGNIAPDINKLSYVQGYLQLRKSIKEQKDVHAWRISHQEKLTWNDHRVLLIGGHTAEGARRFINRKFRRLDKKEKYSVRDYYHMGKMLHYIADSFTHPHTMEYHNGFFSHVDFEERLHEICKTYMKRMSYVVRWLVPDISLDILYRAYRSEEPEPYNDYVYIVTAYTNCMNLLK